MTLIVLVVIWQIIVSAKIYPPFIISPTSAGRQQSHSSHCDGSLLYMPE